MWKLRSNCPDAEVDVRERGRERAAIEAAGLETSPARFVVQHREPPHGPRVDGRAGCGPRAIPCRGRAPSSARQATLLGARHAPVGRSGAPLSRKLSATMRSVKRSAARRARRHSGQNVSSVCPLGPRPDRARASVRRTAIAACPEKNYWGLSRTSAGQSASTPGNKTRFQRRRS